MGVGDFWTPGSPCNNFCVQLRVMKESWTRLATIPYWSSCLRPICTSKNAEKVLMLETEVERVEMNLLCNVKLIVCNLKEYTYRRIFYDPKPRIEETIICGKPLFS